MRIAYQLTFLLICDIGTQCALRTNKILLVRNTHCVPIKLLVRNAHCVPMTRYWYAMRIAYQCHILAKMFIGTQCALRTNNFIGTQCALRTNNILLVHNAHCVPITHISKNVIGTQCVPIILLVRNTHCTPITRHWYAMRIEPNQCTNGTY